MSRIARDWAWAQNIPYKHKIVLLALADFHNAETGRCFPAIKKVARICGMSGRTVHRALDFLEGKGLLRREHRSKGGIKTSSQYHLHVLPTGHIGSANWTHEPGREPPSPIQGGNTTSQGVEEGEPLFDDEKFIPLARRA